MRDAVLFYKPICKLLANEKKKGYKHSPLTKQPCVN